MTEKIFVYDKIGRPINASKNSAASCVAGLNYLDWLNFYIIEFSEERYRRPHSFKAE